MPLVPSFTAGQTIGEPSEITLTDTSTGSDVAIVTRHVYISLGNNKFLVEQGNNGQYSIWAYSLATINLVVLQKDSAVFITVEWLDINGTVLYSKTNPLYGFTLYNETKDYNLTQNLTANPLLINDNNFLQNKSDLRTFIDSGNQAISLASDQFSAQLCYDMATDLRIDSQYFFNESN